MGLTASQRRTLSRKAADNSLEVEHLLKVADLGDAKDAPFLRALQNEHLGRWTDTVCRFLEDGYPGLVQAAKDSAESVDFCVSVLENLKTTASVSALPAIGGKVIERPAEDVKRAVRLANGFNLLLSFKDAPTIAPAVDKQVRNFLHRLVAAELSEVQCASVVCALRGVGDAESAALITSLPPFRGQWAGLEQTAVRQIKQRLRRPKGSRG